MEKYNFQIIKDDPYLEPFQGTYHHLHHKMNETIERFSPEGGLSVISESYKRFGVHRVPQTIQTYTYEEWAPQIEDLTIFGDFNQWNRSQFHAIRNQYGQWKCTFTTKQPIKQFSKLKCQVKLKNGDLQDRIPAWINFTHQNPDNSYDGVYVQLGKYNFKYDRPSTKEGNLKIYQCHIGMSGIDPKIHSYTYFKDNILKRVSDAGYNAIQIMAIMQHPYYGSFGYHVSNFFSISSRFGKPHEFKQLVDQAHRLNIKVIIDIVHAHAAKNKLEGINYWDGTQYQYFHAGEDGIHKQWDSRLFNYEKYQVLRFLLSNIRFWLEEYNADGFRFDGVTSILYKHHGVGYGFTGNYHQYFNDFLNHDAIVYLMIANLLAKNLYENVILIAEDVSGFPGLCRSLEDGGMGFNYRLAMAIPDMWIKLLKEVKDEDWDIPGIVHQLTNRRWKQNTICYAQSHDQALVGDKTLSMWLFNEQVYTNMSVLNQQTPVIFRGMALHKMIRLLTLSLGGEGYLNFMGNQFGHPQWIDFPREGNNWSYHHCRRKWNLADDKDLRYYYLGKFDQQMIKLEKQYNLLCSQQYQYIRTKDNQDKILTYEKGNLLFVFNWHPSNSYNDYKIYVKKCKQVKVLWSTDDINYGGHGRVSHQAYQVNYVDQFCGNFQMYIPNRSATVFLCIE